MKGGFFENQQALFLYELAFTYYKAGDLDKALDKFEKITKLTLGRLYFGDLYAKSFYYLGKTNQKKDHEGKAIDNYEKFLDLWKNADPGLPEKEDARKQLKKLNK